MRHGKKTNNLGRTAAHRRAMLANMASSLIQHKRINTTVAKAKALKKFVEPLITKSKDDNTHNRRIVFSYLRDKDAVAELFREVVDKVGDRPGGYTRIIRTGNRLGDNAEMCMVELVDFNELYGYEKSGKSGRKRSRRGGKKKTTASAEAKTETAPEAKAGKTEEAAPAKEKEAPKAEKAKPETTEAKTGEKAATDKKAKEEKPEKKAENKAGKEAGAKGNNDQAEKKDDTKEDKKEG